MIAEDASVDFYAFHDLLTPEERAVQQRVRTFIQEQVLPTINERWERAEMPIELLPEMGKLGILGGTIQGYGCPGLGAVGAGLTSMEMARGDGSVQTILAVQSGLAMPAIYYLGSEEQRLRWLPPMARGEVIGAFALTEPAYGSDAAHLQTQARRDGDSYVLNGQKRWIGNASVAQVTTVWARDDEGRIGAFLVEQGTPGFRPAVITGKGAQRSIWQAEIALEDCRIPLENRLAKAQSFRDITDILLRGRLGISWAALGHALAGYEIALAYAKERKQFGKPLAAFQLVQDKLVRMLADITAMQLLSWRASKLCDEGTLTAAMASLAKLNNASKARRILADARDLLGGNGILLENHVIRHLTDLEGIYTYEGTDHTNSLLIGRAITGFSAFA